MDLMQVVQDVELGEPQPQMVELEVVQDGIHDHEASSTTYSASNTTYSATVSDAISKRKKSKHKRSKRSQKDTVHHVTCSLCHMKFTFASNLHRHMKNIHKKAENCREPGCGYRCSSKRQLMLHMDLEHRPEMEREELTFNNIKEFYDWKLKEEVQNFVCYTKRRGDIEMLSSHHEFYVCYLNRRAASSRQVKDMNSLCPSRMLLKQSKKDGRVHLIYYKTHSHKLTFSASEHLPMPDCLRYDIKEKLRAGMSVDEVESQLRKEHKTQLAISIAYFNRLQKFDKVQIAMIQKSLMKKGFIIDKADPKIPQGNIPGNFLDGEIVTDGVVHMEIEPGQGFCGDLVLTCPPVETLTAPKKTIVPFINEIDASEQEKKVTLELSSAIESNSELDGNHVETLTFIPVVGDMSEGGERRVEVSPHIQSMFQQILQHLGKDSVKETNVHLLEKSVEHLLAVCKDST